MALIESTNIRLQSRMPDFRLADPDNTIHESNQLVKKNGLAIFFTCNHCPYAIAIWPRIIKMYMEFRHNDLGFVAINPNIHPDYPEDSPSAMKQKIQEWEIPFPYLIDANQQVAKQYEAQCTPDIYLLDGNMNLVYHGRLDDNWKDPNAVRQQDFKIAALNLIEGEEISTNQKPSMGCSIKWTN